MSKKLIGTSWFYTLIFLGVLVACTNPSIFVIEAQVLTEVTGEPPCQGSLQGHIVYAGDVLYDSGRVAYGENVSAFINRNDNPIPTTAQVQIEAWCYGADGAEVGYTKFVGPFGETPLNSPSVRFANRLWSEPDSGCREPTESRGQPPCVYF